ncbi:general stress protein [[Brevibacterium] frigoritolerans]|uniref:General stress protein n=1 Tax=Peribacillus frigoritolerans TaxID=450367 RepID=A0A941FK40_9BACI|nr:general stress protein [Peribacillus frigoritolerans]
MIQAIQSLKEKGVHEGEITVMADKKEDLDFVNEKHDPDVEVVTNSNEESFIDKMKHFFLNEGSEDIRNRLGELGLADSEATAYINEVEAGKFLILLDESETVTARENITFNRIEDTDAPAENPLKTGVVNNPTRTFFRKQARMPIKQGKWKHSQEEVKSFTEIPPISMKMKSWIRSELKKGKSGEFHRKIQEAKPGIHEGTLASDLFADDADKNHDAQGSLDRTAGPTASGQQEEGLQDEYIKIESIPTICNTATRAACIRLFLFVYLD